jgi:quercetin dioxygenase-like cupin family protein
MIKTAGSIGLTLLLAASAAMAQHTTPHATPRTTSTTSPKDAKVTPLLTREMKDIPGKEVLMITVDYPPGAVDPVHRHDAHSFVYVLEGSIVMGVKGGKEVTLKPGDTFYEGPDDIHTVGRNASKTRPAKFVVTLVKNTGAEFFIPVK